MKINKTYMAVALIALALLSRLLPHPANFSPIMAIALFGGAVFANKKWFFLIPVAGLVVSDLFLGFHSLSVLIYALFALVAFIGLGLKNTMGDFNSKNILSWGKSSVLASVLFFVISNLGVFFVSGIYPMSSAGLIECFVLAVPFFHNTLISTLLYSFALFGLYSFVTGFSSQKGKVAGKAI